MIRYHKALLIILTGLLLFSPLSQGILFAATDYVPTPFTDLPSDPMYYPAIEIFQNQNIIIGDTAGGSPIAKLRPVDHLQRAEFTKVATMVRLLEEKQGEGVLNKYINIDLNEFTLNTNSLLRPYYSPSPGAPHFTDVPDKELTCAKDPGGCEPWFTQYVNYMASLGTIKGYTEDNTFRPKNSILKVHGLKLAIASDGSLPSAQDPKVIRLSQDSRIQNRIPRCLAGAEEYILANNGGNTQDSQNLLAYALLADKLDIFGNRCQAFTDAGINLYDKQAIADYLQTPIRRQEIARYFALTTTIPELKLDPATDPTVDSKNEYIMPISNEIKEEKNSVLDMLNKKLQDSKTPTVNTPAEHEGEEETIETIYTGSPTVDMTDEGCWKIPMDRANTKEIIMSCIGRMKWNGKSDEEINRILKEKGLWDFVKDERGNSIIVRTETVAGLVPIRPSTAKVNFFNGLDEHNRNHTISETCRYGRTELAVGRAQESFARQWCSEAWSKREDGMKDWMENQLEIGNTALDTCRLAIQGKKKHTREYKVVVEWCRKEGIDFRQAKNELERILEEKTEAFRIDKKEGYDVKGLEFQSIPKPSMNMDMGGLGVTRSEIKTKEVTKKFYITKQGNTDSNKADPNRNTYIIIHGWNAPLSNQNKESWIRGTAEVILGEDKDPDAQILLINWKDIAHTKLPIDASKWIDGVATTTADALFKWGVNTDKIIIIGNSLGSLLSQELSEKLGGAKVVGLAPAYWFTGYDVDFNGKHFAGFKNKGMCIVADGSISDSETLAKTCGEKYIVKYNDPHNTSFTKEFTKNVAVSFVISEIADLPLKSLNEGAFKTVVKAGNETLIIEVLSKDINGKEIVVGTAKAVGIDIASNWACSPALATPVIGVLAHKACRAVVSTAVEEITDEIKRALVSRHMWVHETYEEIIRHPFTNMDNGRLDSIDHKAEFTDNSYKGMNGAIYTQKHAPTKIKYLLTSTSDNLDRYTLYGNSQDNKFECKTDPWDFYIDTKKDCIMYGGYGNDEFLYDSSGSLISIEDFKGNSGDGDKLIIDAKFDTYSISQSGEKVSLLLMSLKGGTTHYTNISLKGPSAGEVEGWVRDAKNEDGKYTRKELAELPIVIQ